MYPYEEQEMKSTLLPLRGQRQNIDQIPIP